MQKHKVYDKNREEAGPGPYIARGGTSHHVSFHAAVKVLLSRGRRGGRDGKLGSEKRGGEVAGMSRTYQTSCQVERSVSSLMRTTPLAWTSTSPYRTQEGQVSLCFIRLSNFKVSGAKQKQEQKLGKVGGLVHLIRRLDIPLLRRDTATIGELQQTWRCFSRSVARSSEHGMKVWQKM